MHLGVVKQCNAFLLCLMACIVLLTSCTTSKHHCTAQNITLAREGLKGKVRWMKEGTQLFMYDEKGNLIYTRAYQKLNQDPADLRDTVELFETFFKYDSKGRFSEEFGDWLFKQRKVTKYDKKGRIAEDYCWHRIDSTKNRKYVYHYKNGTKGLYLLKVDKELLLHQWKYDDHGNLIEEIRYTDDGKMKITETIKYDNNNLPTEKITVDERWNDGNIKELYRYDGRGNNILYEVYSVTGKPIKREIKKYDARDKLTEKHEDKYDVSGVITYAGTTKYEYKYDPKGRLIEEREASTSGNHYFVGRELYSGYDKHGNYTRRERIYEDWKDNEAPKVQQSKWEREIEYYK